MCVSHRNLSLVLLPYYPTYDMNFDLSLLIFKTWHDVSSCVTFTVLGRSLTNWLHLYICKNESFSTFRPRPTIGWILRYKEILCLQYTLKNDYKTELSNCSLRGFLSFIWPSLIRLRKVNEWFLHKILMFTHTHPCPQHTYSTYAYLHPYRCV